MTIVFTAWYLFGLLAVAALLESAMTCVPSAQAMHDTMLAVTAVLAVTMAATACWLTISRKRNPDSAIFRSKPVAIAAMCVAALATLVVLLGVVG